MFRSSKVCVFLTQVVSLARDWSQRAFLNRKATPLLIYNDNTHILSYIIVQLPATSTLVLREAIAADPRLWQRLGYTNATNMKPFVFAVVGVAPDHLSK